MTSRELNLKEITSAFAIWEAELNLLGSINLQDGSVLSEHTILLLLNEIYGFDLVNANLIKKNYPAVDLIDNGNRIAFQVTMTSTAAKIQKTVDSYIEHQLNLEFDVLYILLLSRKQKSYKALDLSHLPDFNPKVNILDLRDLLHQINYLPTIKIDKIRNIVRKEISAPLRDASDNSAARIKRSMINKKKFTKNFLREVPMQHWEQAKYDPWIRFNYHNVILRDPSDKEFPEVNSNSKWLKMEFWDTYDQGVEFITSGGQAIFDENGNWDILDHHYDIRRSDPRYSVRQFWVYPRLAFADIIEIDMSPDVYYGVPTIYCHFRYDEFPHEEIMFGEGGSYENKSWRSLFDNRLRKKEGW